MNKEEILSDIKDILIRIEGAKNVLRKGDVLAVQRKLQGMQDKAGSVLSKLNKDNDSVLDKVKEHTGCGCINKGCQNESCRNKQL